MQILITRQNPDGTWDNVGTNNRVIVRNIASDVAAMRAARKYAGGRGYRIEFYSDDRPYSEPLRVLEQPALPFGPIPI